MQEMYTTTRDLAVLSVSSNSKAKRLFENTRIIREYIISARNAENYFKRRGNCESISEKCTAYSLRIPY